jgi:mono/diheme cytochrome c family protein
MRTGSAALALVGLTLFGLAAPALSQSDNGDAVSKGHFLAMHICSICHLAAPDQASKPLLNPPGPPFAAIARQPGLTEESLEKFIAAAHRGLDNPKGMPNPDLAAYQIKQVAAYIMSLRK